MGCNVQYQRSLELNKSPESVEIEIPKEEQTFSESGYEISSYEFEYLPEKIPWPREADIKTLDEREKEALEIFRNELKDPWGQKDVSIYSLYGEVLKTPHLIPESGENEILCKLASLKEIVKSVSYRGVIIGEDALEAIKRMDFPKEAIYSHNYDYGNLDGFEGYPKPYNLKEVSEWIEEIKNTGCMLFINLFLDKNHQIIEKNNMEDGKEYTNISIDVEYGKITDYFSSVFIFDKYYIIENATK